MMGGMKKPLIIANWKQYIEKPEVAARFATTLRRQSSVLKRCEVGIAPPYTLMQTLAGALGLGKKAPASIRLGAQAISPFVGGAHTGGVSPAMLKTFGASFCIVGHSERRYPTLGTGETDAVVRAQVSAAAKAGLQVVLCVGEREHDSSGGHFSFIAQQLTAALKGGGAGEKVLPATKLVIAYEPVWAIGKSAADALSPSAVEEMVLFIRKTLVGILGRTAGVRVPILYGGSVEAVNAPALLAEGGVSGFLVGHASASAESFIAILRACVSV